MLHTNFFRYGPFYLKVWLFLCHCAVTPNGCPREPLCTQPPTIQLPIPITLIPATQKGGCLYYWIKSREQPTMQKILKKNTIFRNESPSSKRVNGRKSSCTTVIHQTNNKSNPKIQISPRLSHSNASGQAACNHHNSRLGSFQSNNNNPEGSLTNLHTIGRRSSHHQHHHHHHHEYHRHARRHNWLLSLCFRGQKVLRVPPASSEPPESVVFELSEQ